jgi:hypothetical protein
MAGVEMQVGVARRADHRRTVWCHRAQAAPEVGFAEIAAAGEQIGQGVVECRLPRGVELDAALRRTSTRELNSGQDIGRIPAFWDMDLRLGWRPRAGLEVSLSGRHTLHAHQVEYGFPNSAQVAIGRSVFGKIVWQF